MRRTAVAAAGLATVPTARAVHAATRPNPIGVSTYSFWRFDGPKENYPIEMCINEAAKMGFDGVELLHIQMTSEEPGYLYRVHTNTS